MAGMRLTPPFFIIYIYIYIFVFEDWVLSEENESTSRVCGLIRV